MSKIKKKKITNKKNFYKKMNKKGLWGFSDIANWWQAITGVMPKPVIFIIFLTIMILLAQLLTFFFNMNGIFCTTTNIPVQTTGNFFTSILTNLNLMGEIPDPDLIGKEIIDPTTEQPTTSTLKCSFCVSPSDTIPSVNRFILFENGSKIPLTETRCFTFANGCVDCLNDEVVTLQVEYGADTENLCYKDAYRKPNEEKSFLAKRLCGAQFYGRCEPPEHYFYSYRDNTYRCADQTCDGITAGQIWDEKLVAKGATPLYKTIEGSQLTGKAYNEGIGISCENLRPKLSFYSLELFDFVTWLFILLLIILIWIYKTFIG